MTEAETIKRKIELQFQYIDLLAEEINKTRTKVRELQSKLLDLRIKSDPAYMRVYVGPLNLGDGFWPEGVKP